jgi:uncharacterized protein
MPLLLPEIKVQIDYSALSPEMAASLNTVTVSEDLEAPAMFALKFISHELVSGAVKWADDSLFEASSAVRIQLGYQAPLETVISGEITGLEPEFYRDQASALIVRGYSLSHRLTRGRKTRTFTNMSARGIAGKIAREHGLSAEGEPSKLQMEYISQSNQTDLEFLHSLAKRIGYEVFVEDKTLYFRSPKNDKAKVLTLSFDNDLIEFLPRLSTMGLTGDVEFRSWSSKKKQVFSSKVSVGKENTVMGSMSGPNKVNKAFAKATIVIADEPVFTQEQADAIALAQFNIMALSYITGETESRQGD